MTTPNLFALMGRLEELMQNEKRYLALRKRGLIVGDERQMSILLEDVADKYADELIEEQGEQKND